MHTDTVNTEHNEHWLGLDDSDTDKLAGVMAIGSREKISRISALEIWQP